MAGPLLNLHMANTLPSDIPELILLGLYFISAIPLGGVAPGVAFPDSYMFCGLSLLYLFPSGPCCLFPFHSKW